MTAESLSGNQAASQVDDWPLGWNSVHMDAVRGLAAVVVMLGHNRDLFFSSVSGGTRQLTAAKAQVSPQGKPGQPFTNGQITIGNEMVIVFFVLSGYLVGGSVIRSLKKQQWSWPNYLLKRMTRLWVALLPALLVGFALDHLGMHFFGGPQSIYAGPPPQQIVPPTLATRLAPEIYFLNAFFVQGIRVPLAGTNDSLWSLANEFWYYLAFPAMLLVFAGWLRPLKRFVALVVLALIAFFTGPVIGALFPLWMSGAVLARVPRTMSRRVAIVGSWVLALAFPVVCVVVRRLPLPLWIAQYLVASFFLALLWFLLHQVWASSAGIYRTVARGLSRMSYTLYLVHVPVAVLLTSMLNPVWHVLPRNGHNLLLFGLVNLVALLVASVLYWIFERNTDRIRNSFQFLLPSKKLLETKLHSRTGLDESDELADRHGV